MFGRRQPSQAPPPAAHHATRKSSIHASSSGYEKMSRSLSDSFERRSIASPRKLHRKNSMDLQSASTILENSVYSHQVIETIGSGSSESPTAPNLHALVQQKRVPVVFTSLPWMEHVIGLFTFVCSDRLIVWNSQALNRALSLPETIQLEFPRELGSFDLSHATVRITTLTTDYSSCNVAISATLITADGIACLWHDVQTSNPPAVVRLGLADGEHVVHVSGTSSPLYAATSQGRVWEVTQDGHRIQVRLLPSHANGGVFSGLFRLLSSKTPSPIQLTKALPASSELLVLHVDSTLERLAMTPAGLEDQWRFEMASFMYNYFSQHENDVLGYARCLAMPYATPSAFTLLVGFQAASAVVLYLFEFTATLAETPQFLRCARLGELPEGDMDAVRCHAVDNLSLYVVTPSVVYAVSVPPAGELRFERLPVVTGAWVGSGALGVRDTKALVYLEVATETLGDSDVLDGALGRVIVHEWHVAAPSSTTPAPKRHKPDSRPPFSSSNVDEWCTVLLEQFQQATCHLQLVAKSDQSRQAFHRAVLALDSDIIDAKPATGLRWGADAQVLTPQLVKYQLKEKWTRHTAFVTFLRTHPDDVAATLPAAVLDGLHEHEEKLHTATALCALQAADDPSLEPVLRDAMQRAVAARGYAPDELAASGYSAFDMFYCDLTLFDDIFAHLYADDDHVHARLRVVARLVDAAHVYRAQHFPTAGPIVAWAVQPAGRDTARRLLQHALSQWSAAAEADTRSIVELATRVFVPAMDDDDVEKAAWQTSVVVPLVRLAEAAPGLRDAAVALVRALDYYEGMAYLGTTETSVTDPRFAHFLFQWHAGEIANPWGVAEVHLDALLAQPRELLPSLHTFLLNHATLSKHAWIVGVELGKYQEVAVQALAEATEETTSLAAKKTLASLGKLAAYAADGSVSQACNHELERIHIQEAVCTSDASVPMSPQELIAACLEPVGTDGVARDTLEHRVLMALDVVDSLEATPELLADCRARAWQACIVHDAAAWATMAASAAGRSNDVALEAQMKALLLFSVARRYVPKHAAATPAVVDSVLVDDDMFPGDVNRTIVRQLVLQTLALAGSS
ncbi:hypothetical protein ACHHYP_13649 [Achlya hypogyna]|uniref:Nuclear pore complex protein n=1 Tax=Achlya hypogyna TaxID=1202772 RepID=A0A1V9ZFJ2_ACHHY|nr:hypothetical protein ACHHYP_13649 [Achlya hypogyna]